MSTVEVLSPIAPTPHNTLQLQIQSAVDQDGAFAQDKVLKSGWLMKRTRKTKGWKRRWFVLRADRLSSYKDEKEYKIHRQIYLDDVTAVAVLKDAKSKNVFGVFSPSKNFRFKADTEDAATAWADTIRNAASVEETEEEFFLNSPINTQHPPQRGRMSAQTLDYSGPEFGSVSSLSDMARISQLSLGHQDPGFMSGGEMSDQRVSTTDPPRGVNRNNSGLSTGEQAPREIWHGYLYYLKSKSGVKQWKKYWVVVKNINVSFYKNPKEYRVIKILPWESIVDAVEIDPLSKSRKHCMQIITEGKTYRLSALNEDDLVRSLGAMKSALAKSKPKPQPPQPAQPQH